MRAAFFPRGAGTAARGTLILLNGRSEFIEKYFEVIGEFASRGFDVATLDWRGQGLSTRALTDRQRGHVVSFAEYDRDLACLMAAAQRRFQPPFIMLAHSMGGQIGVRGLKHFGALFSKAVICAPMLAVNLPIWMRPVAGGMARGAAMVGKAEEFAPGGENMHAFASEFETNPVTMDRRRFDRNRAIIRANMDLMLAGPTMAWFAAAKQAMAASWKKGFAASLPQKLLFLTAGKDVFVQTLAIHKFALQARDATLLHVGNAKHELLMERDDVRAQVWAAMDEFLKD
ncbi:MAG TPA: alpha/beta hydrolase [Micropepsaceae bacterium]|nr:alpha/beta hydrolase [Micropepsaceae bacterium]